MEDEKEEKEEEKEESEGEEDEDKGEYPEGEPAGVEGDEPPADSSDIGEPGKAKFTLDEFLSMMQEAGYDVNEMGFDHVLPANEPPMEESGPEIGEGEVKRRNKVMSKMHTMRVGRAAAAANPDHDLNLEEILAMLEAEEAGQPESETMASEVQALQEELAEYRKAVDILRGKLHEVNLLNAKLLYTNKIFRKEGLTNEQKVTIVENFDRATTIREVKMVYAVLAESLIPQKSVKVAGTKKIVAEGFASKATPSTAPKTEAPEVIAENSVAKRLQQLAGIIS